MEDNLKRKINKSLIEVAEKNILGVLITKPNQELIVMVGVPGSGKSTKAKSLVENGVIHSTDDIISSMGDYRVIFEGMTSTGDFSTLSKAHNTNLKNALTSMKSGASPVVIDNTNLNPKDIKPYVVGALNMGFDDKNIKIVDVGTGGLIAEDLAKRNTHGVPLDKIKSMIQRYNTFKPLTVGKILESDGGVNKEKVLYSAVVLDNESKQKLLSHTESYIPDGWKIFAHHMTITLGELRDKSDIGKTVNLMVTNIGVSDMVVAVSVEGYTSKNKTPHVTVAVNPDGGKPVMSNDISEWVEVPSFSLSGVITEVKAI